MKQSVYLIAVEYGSLYVLPDGFGYRLPGGECPEDMSHEVALIRSCLEKTEYDISVDDFVCTEQAGDTEESYYSGTFIENITGEASNLTTVPLSELSLLHSPTARSAVESCLQMMRSDAHGTDDEDL